MLIRRTTGASSADSFSLGGALLLALDQLDVGGRSLHLRDDVGHAAALAVVHPVDGLANRRLGGDDRDDLEVRHEADVV